MRPPTGFEALDHIASIASIDSNKSKRHDWNKTDLAETSRDSSSNIMLHIGNVDNFQPQLECGVWTVACYGDTS